MNGDVISPPDYPFARAMEFWRGKGRSVEPASEDLAVHLRAVCRYLFRRDRPVRLLHYDSVQAWSEAICRAGERVSPALVAWGELCQASQFQAEQFLPRLANQSEALENLFRCEVNLRVDFHYAPNSWEVKHGPEQTTAVWLVNYVPRASEWAQVVAVEWALARSGGDAMPAERAHFARAMLGALAECAGFVPLSNGDVLVCRRPTKLLFDSSGRLGCDDGPAVAWADGSAQWWICDTPVPVKLLPTLNRLHLRGKRELIREFLRRELAEYAAFRPWYVEAALRDGKYEVLGADGPWGTPRGSVLRRAELRRVEFQGKAYHYVCELPEPGAPDSNFRAIAVSDTVTSVADALAYSFDLLTPTKTYRVIPRRKAE